MTINNNTILFCSRFFLYVCKKRNNLIMSSATVDAATTDVVSKSIPILDLPLSKYNELCKILNRNDKWAKLAGKILKLKFKNKVNYLIVFFLNLETEMKYDKYTIEKLVNVKNPTCELLQSWSTYNHNTNALFILLSRIQHYRAMKILIPFVDDEYHYLWIEGEGNLGKEIKSSVQNSRKAEAIDKKKNEDETPKILNRNGPNTPRCEGPSNSNNLDVLSQSDILSFSKSKYTTDGLIAFLKEKSLVRKINYKDLADATDQWNMSRLIGRGGFGKVFRGINKYNFYIKQQLII